MFQCNCYRPSVQCLLGALVADRLDDDLGLERLRLHVLERLRDLGDHRGVLTVEAGHVALHGAVDLAVEAGDAVVLWVALDRRAVLEDRVHDVRDLPDELPDGPLVVRERHVDGAVLEHDR